MYRIRHSHARASSLTSQTRSHSQSSTFFRNRGPRTISTMMGNMETHQILYHPSHNSRKLYIQSKHVINDILNMLSIMSKYETERRSLTVMADMAHHVEIYRRMLPNAACNGQQRVHDNMSTCVSNRKPHIQRRELLPFG